VEVPEWQSVNRRPLAASAFTLIEVLIVIGLIMILIGLAVPSISSAYGQARRTRAMVVARECALAVDQYTRVSKDVYPIVKGSALATSWEWPDAMLAAGVASSLDELDPDRNRPPEDRMAATGGINWKFSLRRKSSDSGPAGYSSRPISICAERQLPEHAG
jgi:type II secretory pathway pseudopilin PulG